MKKALVLGGGVQGCTVALMLKKHGYQVNIIDQSTDIFNRTSLNQEGKIHLGFVYGLDFSLRTGKKLLLDSLHFSSYIEYLVERKINWEELKSTSFNYLVSKDSLLSVDAIESYFQKLQKTYDDLKSNENLNYFGTRPDIIFQKVSIPTEINQKIFDACFQTNEVAINPELFKEIIKEKIISQKIPLYLNHNIQNIKRTKNGFLVTTLSNGNIGELESELVFNCLWENKLVFDKQMGITAPKNHNIRFKFGIIMQPSVDFINNKSFSIIQGPYGDFVNYQNSGKIYFSWYPSSMIDMFVDKNMPNKWNRFCKGIISAGLQKTLINENLDALCRILPTFSSRNILSIRGGVIVATGNQDIHDPSSGLHQRFDTPITTMDGYFSINTGKFTSAPHNTLLLEKMLGHV